jgi:hypothetical protein
LNKVPPRKLDKTPYELWKGFAPNLNYLKVCGCLAKVAYSKFKKSNIGPKTFDCAFIGYAQNSATYRFMCLNVNSICESGDVEFFEHVFPLNKTIIVKIAPSRTDLENVSTSKEHENEPRRSN